MSPMLSLSSAWGRYGSPRLSAAGRGKPQNLVAVDTLERDPLLFPGDQARRENADRWLSPQDSLMHWIRIVPGAISNEEAALGHAAANVLRVQDYWGWE